VAIKLDTHFSYKKIHMLLHKNIFLQMLYKVILAYLNLIAKLIKLKEETNGNNFKINHIIMIIIKEWQFYLFLVMKVRLVSFIHKEFQQILSYSKFWINNQNSKTFYFLSTLRQNINQK
jgi:hypothetical protein